MTRGFLQGTFEVVVFYEDTDSLGMLYHANYLKFFDRGRQQLIGVKLLRQLAEEGIAFVVSCVSIRFFVPAAFGDRLLIESEISYSRSPRLRVAQRAQRSNQLLAEAQLELAAVDRRGRPMRLPLWVLQSLEAHQP
jgi:acyl-CoA thioester hydrolase